jgi:hypothetical protein
MKRQGKTLDGILFTHNKEGNAVICDNMDGPGGHYARKMKPGTET